MIRRIALAAAAALVFTAPAFAQDWNGDDSYADDSWDDAPPPPPPDDAYSGPSFADFRNDSELSWAGEWVDYPQYGTVWRPTHVSAGWRPYTYGHWSYTDYGWAWVSDESFGWATYHYGRWAFSDDYGWVWVPGREWAPAWVSWRWGDGAVGWCPLGPRGVVYERPQQWVFVETRYVLEPVQHHAVPIQFAEPWMRRAHAGPVRRGPHAGPPRQIVERAVGREVRPMPVVEASGSRAVAPSSGAVTVYRPHSRPLARPADGPGSPKAWFGGTVDRHRRGAEGGPEQSPHPRGGSGWGAGPQNGPQAGPAGGPRAPHSSAGPAGGGAPGVGAPGSGGPRVSGGGGSGPGAGSPGAGAGSGGPHAGPAGSGGPHVAPGGSRPHATTPEQSPKPRDAPEGDRPHVKQ